MNEPVSPDFAAARRTMVDTQLRPNGITDSRILAAMGDIPREVFVPSTLVGVAYNDDHIKLISGRFLLQPLVLAKLVQAAEIKDKDRVLELAPATGYSTLVLARLTSSVFCVEPDALLHKEVERNIASFAPGRVTALAGAPVEGCIVHAPFDVIFINGSVEFLPDFLFEQLAEGGRLVTIMRRHGEGHAAHIGEARIYRKTKGEMSWKALAEINAPPAPGFSKPTGFKL